MTQEDLKAITIKKFARRTRPYWQLLELFEKAHLHKVRVFANSSLSSIIRMALDGIGVAAIPSQVVAEHLAAGQLRALDTGHEMPVLSFTASFFRRADMPLNSIVAEFAQQVAGQYKGKSDKWPER